ncbi:MAG: bifunctional phosphopantothenoylcysteine decarboxylase/phosphopantothenate--cysteine ligase CoaBC [Propionibacteriaceae bacterium]|jgi:phosphopantothenoylcysteine decarboxylase/phosphopantothenate--cysteine ligase|nr:bifunctional phosphopantothenoylcysteine decarboxylase/phosphopantothenate--cysteine ligase CoaBC [Propionibacteriaceae bacterium]
MAKIVLGVSGGIAAYKSCYLLRRLKEDGHDVKVVPTENSLEFVGKSTWQALSGHRVQSNVFEDSERVNHVHIGRIAELVIVCPATADLIARAAQGRAVDLLTNVLLTTSSPVIMVPAMHTEMFLHQSTQENIATLRKRGVVVMNPAVGQLTGDEAGPGRLPAPEDILALVNAVLASPRIVESLCAQDYSGCSVLVNAGGTHEQLDPVRFLGNSSSGKMGISIARAAYQRGAWVTLVAANMLLPAPAGAQVVPVSTTNELLLAMRMHAPDADFIIMAAAPADFQPRDPTGKKIKKQGDGGITLELVQTPDVLKDISASREGDQVVVGFAAETVDSREELVFEGVRKLKRKGCNLMILNDVSGGEVFGADYNDAIIVSAEGVVAEIAASKDVVAHTILDEAFYAVPSNETALNYAEGEDE